MRIHGLFLDWQTLRTADCILSYIYELTQSSHGSYSIITSPWPRVLAGVSYKATMQWYSIIS